VAARNAAHLRRARALKASAAILSPLFPTPSHPDRPPLGVTRAAVLVRSVRLPVIALGGITRQKASRLRASGCAGIAGIGFAVKREKARG